MCFFLGGFFLVLFGQSHTDALSHAFLCSCCKPFISVLSPIFLCVGSSMPPSFTPNFPLPRHIRTHAQTHTHTHTRTTLLRLFAVTVSLAGLGNNVQRAPLSRCELFSQHDTRLCSYVNPNYWSCAILCALTKAKVSHELSSVF